MFRINFLHEWKKRKYRGQALLFVVVGMTIALTIGVSVALRTLASTSRVAMTDTSQRVLAAAEGGLEKFLSYPMTGGGLSLENLSMSGRCDGNYDSGIPSECIVRFVPLADDNIEARALLEVVAYGFVSPYVFTVSQNSVMEVSLEGYGSDRLRLCWEGSFSDLHYLAYGDAGFVNGLVCSQSGCIAGDAVGETLASSGGGGCPSETNDNAVVLNMGGVGSLMGLRILSLGGDSSVAVVALGGSTGFPVQGYTITATGELSEHGDVQATKTISVRKSFPYLPAVFDFGIYVEGGIN